MEHPVKKVVATNKNSKAYYVEMSGGDIKETPLPAEVIL